MSEFSQLAGVGPKREKILREAGILTLRDLVYHLPRKYVDRTRLLRIADLRAGEDCLFAAMVERVDLVHSRLIVRVDDGTGQISLVFFNGTRFWRRRFEPGQQWLIAGTPSFFRDDLQLVHPETETVQPGETLKGYVLPRYPLTEEMAASHMEHRFLQRVALEALERFTFTDPVAASLREELGLEAETSLLRGLHAPPSIEALPDLRRQLKCRELLPFALRLERMRRERERGGRSWSRPLSLHERLKDSLPFELTAGQEKVIREIQQALERPYQFHGLLQGDVGSGKTVVSMLAASSVLEQGGQVAFMAPTEILAAQHDRTLRPFLEAAGIACGLLTGDTPREERRALLEDTASGRAQFLIGTHALFSPDVEYARLGLAIIDEQHRFGVDQRQKLIRKGDSPDVLYMSATPIPRTLAHTLYGDLDMFLLEEKPKHRLPVKTRLVPPSKRGDMLGFLLEEAGQGNQVFWVVPQIGPREGEREEDFRWGGPQGPSGDAEDLPSVERVLGELKRFSRDWRVGLVHGRLPWGEKEAALKAFGRGELQVLVATTVIEVGVDVPQANLMVIEHPDRFGLAQLHQLRGRTGRGTMQAWCFLAEPETPPGPEAAERLRRFCELDDGFAIAELDLDSRGAGHLLGTVQSGFNGLRHVDIKRDFALIREVRALARRVLDGDKGVADGELERLLAATGKGGGE